MHPMQDVVGGPGHDRFSVTPDGEYPAGNQHTIRFAEERRYVEPVECLRDSDEVNRCTGEPRFTLRGNGVRDSIVGHRCSDLLRARIGRDDLVELFGEKHSRLAVPRGTVPRASQEWRKRREICDHIRWVRWSERRVRCGAMREVIAKGHEWTLSS